MRARARAQTEPARVVGLVLRNKFWRVLISYISQMGSGVKEPFRNFKNPQIPQRGFYTFLFGYQNYTSESPT